jgi:putative glutamine amidotransferase
MNETDLSVIMKQIDGVMMIGGADYPPETYKQKAHPSVSLMKNARSDFDLRLVKAVLADKSMPFLGICAGCQALNIGSGGSLTQDIPSLKPDSIIKHSSPQGWKVGFNKHPVEIDKGSKLAESLGQTQMTVVTSHHQCVDTVGSGLEVVAKSPDGLTEAVEEKGERFVVGVQWHPERDYASNHKLFDELIHKAAQRHAARNSAKSAS